MEELGIKFCQLYWLLFQQNSETTAFLIFCLTGGSCSLSIQSLLVLSAPNYLHLV